MTPALLPKDTTVIDPTDRHALTERQQIIVDLLSEGPRTTRELAEACGVVTRADFGAKSISKVLKALKQHGYAFHNYTTIGSHRGAYYALVGRPSVKAEQSGKRRCRVCGCLLARDHSDPDCSPCVRRAVDWELAMQAPATLWEVAV